MPISKGTQGKALLILTVAIAMVIGMAFICGGTRTIQNIGDRRSALRGAPANCSKATTERCEELKLQIRSANAYEDTVDVAIWQVGTNIAGLGGLFLTVVFAAGTWVETRRSANTAHDALHNLERPWMIMDGCTVTRRNPSEVANSWFAAPKWKNIGRTPAILEELLITLGDIDLLPEKVDYKFAAPLNIQRFVGVGEEFEQQGFGPSAALEKDGKPVRFIVYGVLSYRGLSGGPIHKTGFSFEVSAHLPAISSYVGESYDYYT